MNFHLVAVQAFAEHAVGNVIADAEQIKAALAEHAEKVVRIFAHLSPASAAPKEG